MVKSKGSPVRNNNMDETKWRNAPAKALKKRVSIFYNKIKNLFLCIIYKGDDNNNYNHFLGSKLLELLPGQIWPDFELVSDSLGAKY